MDLPFRKLPTGWTHFNQSHWLFLLDFCWIQDDPQFYFTFPLCFHWKNSGQWSLQVVWSRHLRLHSQIPCRIPACAIPMVPSFSFGQFWGLLLLNIPWFLMAFFSPLTAAPSVAIFPSISEWCGSDRNMRPLLLPCHGPCTSSFTVTEAVLAGVFLVSSTCFWKDHRCL